MQTFIENMPKAELHVHLEGTLEPELSFELAQRNQIDLPYKTPDELIAAYNFYDLPSFLTIYYIIVDRIDHGVNSLEDDALCEAIKKRGLGLTVCPVSNRFVVQSLTSTEIRTMLQKGMLATINSDDPAYFRAYLNENLVELQQEGQFTSEEITTLVGNAFRVAWLPEAQKNHYLTLLNEYVTTITDQPAN